LAARCRSATMPRNVRSHGVSMPSVVVEGVVRWRERRLALRLRFGRVGGE